jgi:L-alanine-DL-glutamate epimerase-like enolase superfamily enzyme
MRGSLTLHTAIEQWPLITPFRITGYTFEALNVLVVTLECDGSIGRGEAAGVYYNNESPASMARQIEPLCARIEGGLSRAQLQHLLPPGGARGALDCALWDLEAKMSGQPVWQLAKLDRPAPLLTTFTCGAGAPAEVASAARKFGGARAIKLKLTGGPTDADCIRSVRDARPEVWLGVDANQGLRPASLERLLPSLVECDVALLEQPFPVGEEHWLEGLQLPIRIAADESVQSLEDLPGLLGRFQVVNIKLDKCGGLTEGLKMARRAHELGLGVMVGNMMGTSLAMAPAHLLGQLADFADLDGPIFLKTDRDPCVRYHDGFISLPPDLWG